LYHYHFVAGVLRSIVALNVSELWKRVDITGTQHHVVHHIQGTPIKKEPLGKIRYLWNCSRYIYQIYRVYRWGFSPHILQILLK